MFYYTRLRVSCQAAGRRDGRRRAGFDKLSHRDAGFDKLSHRDAGFDKLSRRDAG
ncbi:hypothetical protein [Candidatus Viridilinea mediisalina]|uniref:hypothetical protein n=1 Tax=Candidatus Viridilinea mediisalina TaxID=2024553 RepID=UPI0013FD7DA5|nr:hypothetical protein [Candidatus Viridilinea mediisalina]